MYEIEKFVPRDAIRLYTMIWQFEKWLRLMVYVELNARDNKWEEAINRHVKDWPPRGIEGDKKLSHMTTAHQSAISFLSLGELWEVICDKVNWKLFEKYFPPKDNIDARIKEIKNIRNRIMHFREPHEDDVARMTLFLKDFERGVRLFCQSYSTKVYCPKENDELVTLLADHWQDIGYGIDLRYLNSGDLFALPNGRDPIIYARLSLIRRPWSGTNGEGLLYEISINASMRQFNQNDFEADIKNYKHYELDFKHLLSATEKVHDKCIHISNKKGNYSFNALFPAHLGVETNMDTIATVLKAGVDCGVSGNVRREFTNNEIETLSRQFPEYVLWPNNPLFWYDDAMTDSLINLD